MVGLIHAVFPKTKLIRLGRNPIDTGISIYGTHFGGGPDFAYKRENVVFQDRAYLRSMEHLPRV